MKTNNPLQRRKLLQWCGEDGVRQIEQAIDGQIAASVKRADAAPFPGPEELYKDVYA